MGGVIWRGAAGGSARPLVPLTASSITKHASTVPTRTHKATSCTCGRCCPQSAAACPTFRLPCPLRGDQPVQRRDQVRALRIGKHPASPPPLPVQRARKFSTVLGTVLPYRPITILPADWPSISTSKNTWQGGCSPECQQTQEGPLARSKPHRVMITHCDHLVGDLRATFLRRSADHAQRNQKEHTHARPTHRAAAVFGRYKMKKQIVIDSSAS